MLELESKYDLFFCILCQAQLKSAGLGDSVDQVEGLIKRHEAFESLITKQQAKTQTLQDFGDRLLKQRHFDDKKIAETIEMVTERRENVKLLADDRRKKLDDSLLYCQFNRDCLEVSELRRYVEEAG